MRWNLPKVSQCCKVHSVQQVLFFSKTLSKRGKVTFGGGWVASVATLQLATGNEKRIRKKNELKDLCEGHRFHGLKLVEKSEIGSLMRPLLS